MQAADNITDAWDAIFKSYNNANGRGEVGYTTGEKIAFKINLTNQSASTRAAQPGWMQPHSY